MVISYEFRFYIKVRLINTPAHLTWNASLRVLHARCLVNGTLLRTHLLTQEASIRWLINTRLWCIKRLLQLVIKSSFSLLAYLLCWDGYVCLWSHPHSTDRRLPKRIETIFVLTGETSINFNFGSRRYFLLTRLSFPFRICWLDKVNPVYTRKSHLSETEFLRVVSQFLRRLLSSPPTDLSQNRFILSSTFLPNVVNICTNKLRSAWRSRCPVVSLILFCLLLVLDTVIATDQRCEVVPCRSCQTDKCWLLLLSWADWSDRRVIYHSARPLDNSHFVQILLCSHHKCRRLFQLILITCEGASEIISRLTSHRTDVSWCGKNWLSQRWLWALSWSGVHIYI